MRRLYTLLLASTMCFLGVTQPLKSAQTASIKIVVTDQYGRPVPGAQITLTSPSGTWTVTAAADGTAVIRDLPIDTWSVEAARGGFSVTAISKVEVFPDQTQSVHLTINTVLPAAPPPTPKAGPIPGVRASLLAAYNASHPVHKPRTPYFGRYTYVLLTDRSSRSKAFLMALIGRTQASNGPWIGPPTGVDNPWGYNLFVIPVTAGSSIQSQPSADVYLRDYDFNAARNARDRYCGQQSHASNSICNMPWNSGPILLTLLKPLAEVRSQADLPWVVACDLSRVPPEQFDLVIARMEEHISKRQDVVVDEVLPQPMVAVFVAPWLSQLQQAVQALVPAMHIFFNENEKG